MKPLDDFAPHIRLYAPGVADPTMRFALREAAVEFCERTRLWRFEDEYAISAEKCDAIFAPDGAVIHEIESVTFDGQPLTPVSIAWLDENYRGWRTQDYTGVPRYFSQVEPDQLCLVPQAVGTVGLSLWLKPSNDADQLPDWMFNQFRETLAQGAIARILMIPNQSFTNYELGAAFGASFSAKLDDASTKGFTGQQRAPMRTRASFF